jgi:Ca2+-binding EF-hand superfamily protein
MQRLWELDLNKDGGISLEEFKAGNLFKKLTPERQDKLFGRLDADHDGKITPKDKPEPALHRGGTKPEHHRSELRQLLRQLDQNADGALSFEEFRAGPGVKDLSESEQQARFAALDRNHDHLLNREDLPEPEPRPEPQRPNNPAPAP